jgi:hypothetical protein
MSTVTDRLSAKAAVTQMPRRDFSTDWAGIAMLAALAAPLASGKIAQTRFAQEVISRVSSDLQVLDQRWLNVRKLISLHRKLTPRGGTAPLPSEPPHGPNGGGLRDRRPSFRDRQTKPRIG